MESGDNSAVIESSDDDQMKLTDDEEEVAQESKAALRHGCDVYIAEGVYTDCDNILKKFLSLKTSTFEDFVAIWKEKNFSEIFNGRDSYAELLEFSEEVLAIAKSFILPPHSQIKRIGALYLMYGLYTQQPLRRIVKFRITPEEWSIILKFVENLKTHGFLDANYIFHYMKLDGAFVTVAMAREYGLERNYRKYLMPWPARDRELDPNVAFSLETLMSRVYRGSLKAAADKCLNKYNSIKKLLEDKKKSQFHSLHGTEKELDHVMMENMESVVNVSADFLGNTKKFSKNIGSVRNMIKEKAFQNQAQQKGTQFALLPDAENTPAASTSRCDSQTLSKSEDDILLDSDSGDSDFHYMMKPPSMRNSRRIAKKKREEAKEKALTAVKGNKRGTAARKAFYLEVLEADPSKLKPSTHKDKKKQKRRNSKQQVQEDETRNTEGGEEGNIKENTEEKEEEKGEGGGRKRNTEEGETETTVTHGAAESCPIIDISDDVTHSENPSQVKSNSTASCKDTNKRKISESVSPGPTEDLESSEAKCVVEDSPKAQPKIKRRTKKKV